MSATLPIADLFQSLADPSRLRILALLRTMELSVGELAQVLGQSQPRVSRHVKILGDAGLLDRHKEGSWVILALARDPRTPPTAPSRGQPTRRSAPARSAGCSTSAPAPAG